MKARAHAGMPDGWRDVPMPPGVAALPRTNGGIPITYTVAWSSEQGSVVRRDPVVGRDAIFAAEGRQGEGTPKLAIVDTARQRRATVLGLCQVCGRKVPGRQRPPWRQHPRWLADLHKGQGWRIGFRTVPLIIDGWTCEPCLTYALRVCPALVRKDWTPGADSALRLLRVYDAEIVATMERPDSTPEHELPDGAVGLMKIAPVVFEVVPPDAFLTAAELAA